MEIIVKESMDLLIMDTLIYNKILAIEEQIDALYKNFNQLLLKTYPGHEIQNMIYEVREICKSYKHRLNEYKQSNNINFNEFMIFCRLFMEFYSRVECILNCNTKNHPTEIMIPIKEILSHFSTKSVFITEPRWEINFAVGKIFDRDFKDTLIQSNININSNLDIILLRFPRIHQENILLGGIMAHELGHYFDIHYGLDITEKIIPKIIQEIDINRYVPLYQTVNQNQTFIKDELKALLPNVVMRKWIKELVADIIGIMLYGLSSYFAAEQLILYLSDIQMINEHVLKDRFSITHPRNLLRNTVKKMALEKLDYYVYLKEDVIECINRYSVEWEKANVEIFRPIAFYNNGSRLIIDSQYLNLLEEDLESRLDMIFEMTLSEISSLPYDIIYKPQLLKDEVVPLVDKIVKLIPPNEIDGNPVQSVSIINAGWIAYLLHNEEIKEKWSNSTGECDENLTRKVLDNLLKKATVSANVHRRWRDASQQQG